VPAAATCIAGLAAPPPSAAFCPGFSDDSIQVTKKNHKRRNSDKPRTWQIFIPTKPQDLKKTYLGDGLVQKNPCGKDLELSKS
jgi:hypothetical protein